MNYEVEKILRRIARSLEDIAEAVQNGEHGYRWTPEGLPICPKHGVVMKKREKQGDVWFSHGVEVSGKTLYCRGYAGKSSPGWDVDTGEGNMAEVDSPSPEVDSPSPSPEDDSLSQMGQTSSGSPVDATAFWKAFYEMKASGRLLNADSLRNHEIVVEAIGSGDFSRAMKWLSTRLR